MIKKIIWNFTSDRLGPDLPLTHLLLHSKRLGKKLCRRKFGTFGDRSEFRPYAFAIHTSNIFIGSNVVIRPHSMLFAVDAPDGKITIEDDVLIGCGVHIYVSNHRFDDPNRPVIEQGHNQPRQTKICKGAWIGANAVILPGVTINENAVVGAGSIVTRSVDRGAVVAGNPARPILKTD